MKHIKPNHFSVRGIRQMIGITFASLTLVMQTHQPAHALVSTTEVLARVAQLVLSEEEKGYQVLFMQVDFVVRGASKGQTYPLIAGSQYRIWAIGDESRIKDIDLCVFTSRNRQVGCDNDETNLALVSFMPSADGQFTLQTTAAAMNGSVRDGFYGLVVVRVDE